MVKRFCTICSYSSFSYRSYRSLLSYGQLSNQESTALVCGLPTQKKLLQSWHRSCSVLLERLLLPFGLHHMLTIPINYTPIAVNYHVLTGATKGTGSIGSRPTLACLGY